MSLIFEYMNILFAIFVSYFLLQIVYQLVLNVVGLFENRRRNRQDEAEDYSTLAASSFGQPVSFLVPVRNEEEWIRQTIQAILNINYPEFEIIVVNDQSTDKSMKILTSLLELKESPTPYIDRFDSGRITAIHRSEKYPNITVLSKIDSGNKKAGTLNAGLNLAQYRFVCILDADTIIEPNSILKMMSQVQKNPDHVIGIGSSFGLVNGFKVQNGEIIEKSYSYNPIIAYQNIEYIRTFIGNRLAWSKLNSLPIVSGGFGIWRKDILMELGGYDSDFTCEDLEISFRMQKYLLDNKDKHYKILTLPYYVGWTEGPNTVRALISQRSRWQRVTHESVEFYLSMLFNPKYRLFAFLVMPYFFLYEVAGVLFEMTSLALVLAGLIFGFLDIQMLITIFIFMILAQAIVSIVSIFAYIREEKTLKSKDVAYFILLSFLEAFWYRWMISIAKLLGTIAFLRKIRSFDQYTRSKV